MAGTMQELGAAAYRSDPGPGHAGPPEPAPPDPGPAAHGRPDARWSDAGPPWRGSFTPYSVGDPGRAATLTVPSSDRACWDRPDTVLDAVVVAGPGGRPVADLRAASVRGLSHRHYAKVRQDEYAFRTTADGRNLVVAVADGVSEGRLSHLAAKLAVRHGADLLCSRLTRAAPEYLDWGVVLADVASIIENVGRRQLAHDGVPDAGLATVRDVADHLATTILYAVVDLEGAADGLPVHLLSYGDTSAWILDVDGSWWPQQPVKNEGAQIHSSAVAALPVLTGAPPAPVRTTVRPGEALVLMTDGVGDPLAGGTGLVGRFLAEAWRRPPADLEFAAQVGFARKTYDDDRTAVAIWPAARP
jgi:hypothetical protein